MAGDTGLEPATTRLTAAGSTIELISNIKRKNKKVKHQATPHERAFSTAAVSFLLSVFHYLYIVQLLIFGAAGETRTRTLFGQRILSPVCLPIPPQRHIFNYINENDKLKDFHP